MIVDAGLLKVFLAGAESSPFFKNIEMIKNLNYE